MERIRMVLSRLLGMLRKTCPRFYHLLVLITHKRFYSSPSYFPEYSLKRKTTIHRFFDQVEHILKYGALNDFYFLYGLDIKDYRCKDDYVDYTLFMQRREKMNTKNHFSPITILRDKSLFGIVANAYDISTPQNIGIITDGQIYLFEEKRTIGFIEYIKTEAVDAFLKKIDGECADGVYQIISDMKSLTINSVDSTFEDIDNIVRKGEFLLQRRIRSQHRDINAIFSKSVNTIRLATVRDFKSDKIFPLSAVLRVGRGNNCVDNWAAGGLSIGIDIETGKLRKYGFYKPGYGTKAECHPDTGVKFEEYVIPYFQEALNMALKYHKVLRKVHSIGWDIAILEDGPTIIEGNDNWEISLMEVSNHGLKKDFEKYFYD